MTEQLAPYLPCKACYAKLTDGVLFCKVCNSWQGKQCVSCNRWLPVDAKRCDECEMYQQGLRRVFRLSETTLALITALIAVISPVVTVALFLHDRPSNARFAVSGADDRHIYIKVWNTGRQSCTLVGYHLKLAGEFPIDDVELDLTDEDRKEEKDVVTSTTPVTIALVPSNPNWLPRPDHPEGYTPDDFHQYEDRLVTLEIDVEESSGLAHKSSHFPIKRIRAFLCGGCSSAK